MGLSTPRALSVPTFLALTASGLLAPAASAAITYGPQVVTLETSRTWRDAGGSVIASDSVTSGPTSYGPNVPVQAVPSITSATPTLSAPGQPAWVAAATVQAQLEQVGNAQFMRSTGSGGGTINFQSPAIGTSTLAMRVTHTIDFTLDAATPWAAELRTVLSSPIYPAFQIVRDPASAATTVVSDQMATNDIDLQLNIGGLLAAGSYRVTMTFPLSFDLVSSPTAYGAQHGAFTVFTIPAPGGLSILCAAGVVGLRRRRR